MTKLADSSSWDRGLVKAVQTSSPWSLLSKLGRPFSPIRGEELSHVSSHISPAHWMTLHKATCWSQSYLPQVCSEKLILTTAGRKQLLKDKKKNQKPTRKEVQQLRFWRIWPRRDVFDNSKSAPGSQTSTAQTLFTCWARSFNCQGLKIAEFEQFFCTGLIFLALFLSCIKPQCLKWEHISSSRFPPLSRCCWRDLRWESQPKFFYCIPPVTSSQGLGSLTEKS